MSTAELYIRCPDQPVVAVSQPDAAIGASCEPQTVARYEAAQLGDEQPARRGDQLANGDLDQWGSRPRCRMQIQRGARPWVLSGIFDHASEVLAGRHAVRWLGGGRGGHAPIVAAGTA